MQPFDRLFERARAGESGALDELLQRNLAELHAFVRLKAGPALRRRESCSDLVQTVCRQVIEDFDSVEFRGEAAFRNWLFTVAERRVSNKARYHNAEKRDAERERPLVDGADEEALLRAYGTICTPSRAAATSEEVQRIERALDSLTTADRDLILQVRLLGRPTSDVAAELGCSEQTLRQRLARARARLALALEGAT